MSANALKMAGLEVCRIENLRYAAFETTDICVPVAVDEAIKKRIAKYQRRIRTKHRLLNIACIVVALLVICSAVLTINVEARNSLVKMIRKMIGTTIEYTPNMETVNSESIGELKEMKVNWIPDGMELQQSSQDEREITYFYKGTEAAVFITCRLIGDNTSLSYHSPTEKDIEYETGEYDGLYYEFIYANEGSRTNTLILINDINNYYITVNTSLEKGVLFRIYDNLEIFL